MPLTTITAADNANRQQPVPAPDEDKCKLPDELAPPGGDTTNQPAFDRNQLRRLPAD